LKSAITDGGVDGEFVGVARGILDFEIDEIWGGAMSFG